MNVDRILREITLPDILRSVPYALGIRAHYQHDHDFNTYEGECIPNLDHDVHEGLKAQGIDNFCIYFPINDELRVIAFRPGVSAERRVALIREYVTGRPLKEKNPYAPYGAIVKDVFRWPRRVKLEEYAQRYYERHVGVFERLRDDVAFREYYRGYTAQINV